MKINILGTKYTVQIKKYKDDKTFEKNSFCGYCDEFSKKIVICDMHTYKGWENEPEETVKAAQAQTLRHEIVHAFLSESGLSHNSSCVDIPWAKNEEMVDWIALQGQKIYKAWEGAGVI